MSGPSKRLESLTMQLAPPQGNFEDIPRIRSVAPDANTPRMKDKVCIITGANSPLGIGRATAHQFAANGAKAVYICDFMDDHLATHKRELAELYPACQVETRRFDASDEAAVKAVVDDAVRTHGRLDVFFANAGVTGMPIEYTQVEADDFNEVMRVNVLSVFLAAKHAAPAMRLTDEASKKTRSCGSFIATASVAGLRSQAGPTAYSASKAAVVSLMQTCAYQTRGQDIRFNALCPGIIETGMTAPVFEAARDRGTEGKIGQLNPLSRGGVADEIARAALFLASADASYVNGQALPVCGGLSAAHPYVLGRMA